MRDKLRAALARNAAMTQAAREYDETVLASARHERDRINTRLATLSPGAVARNPLLAREVAGAVVGRGRLSRLVAKR